MIDPSIPLSYRPPQVENPLEAIARVQSIKGAQQEQELRGQQMQMGGVQLQQAQMDLEDQQRMRRAWMDAEGDPDKMFGLAVKYGVGPKTLMSTRESILKLATERANLDKTTSETQQTKNDLVHGMLQPVVDETDPVKQKTLWDEQFFSAAKKGLIPMQEVAEHPYPGPDGVKQYAAALTTDKWLTAQGAQMRGQAAQQQAGNAEKRLSLEAPGIQTGNLVKGLDVAGRTIDSVQNQGQYDQWVQQQPADVRAKLPAMYSPSAVDQIKRMSVPAEKQPEYDLTKLRADNGIVGTDKFESVFLPAYAANLGKTVKTLTPQERMASFQVFKQYDTNPEMLQSLLQSRQMTAAMHSFTMQNARFQQGQHSYQFNIGELDKVAKPVDDAVQRMGRLKDTLAQNTPQADALVAPELLTVMAGGQGSGLRLNEAEIQRAAGGRSNWESLKAKLNKWQLDPTKALSITPEQRREMGALIDVVNGKLNSKAQMLNEARTGLSATDDPHEHRQIMTDLHGKLTAVDAPSNSGNAGGSIRVRRKADGSTGTLDPKDFDPNKYEKM